MDRGAVRGRTSGLADGIVLSPSHNQPEDGGYKYNPPNGGPAENEVTRAIEDAANALLAGSLAGVRRVSDRQARMSAHYHRHDYIGPYVADLAHGVEMGAIRASGVKVGIDPLGGAAVPYWAPIIERYRCRHRRQSRQEPFAIAFAVSVMRVRSHVMAGLAPFPSSQIMESRTAGEG